MTKKLTPKQRRVLVEMPLPTIQVCPPKCAWGGSTRFVHGGNRVPRRTTDEEQFVGANDNEEE